MTNRPRDDAFDRLPPIARALSRGEWAATVGIWALFALAAVDAAVATVREQGADVSSAWWMAGTLGVTLAWAAVAPLGFRALDALPVRAGVRVRNLLLRLLLLLALNAAVGSAGRLALEGLVPLLGLDPRLLTVEALSWQTALVGPFDGAIVLLVSHVILQRVHRSRHRQRHAAELESSLHRARLDALAKEVQPHFLFNTLNGITALVREDPARAEAMLVSLGDMLRVTVDAVNDGEIALGEELRRLRLYLDLQRMRFGERLTMEACAGDDVHDALVPAMLLQPLVENALVHGLAGQPGPGAVSVRASREGGRVRITVSDTGIGLPARVLESTGIGNTRTRLRLLHGDQARLELGPRSEGAGTLVTIELPYHPATTTVTP